MEKKSKFATFILSFIVPGTGHLYLGYQTRGLQLMAAFFGCIVLMSLMPLVFSFALAIIWIYGMFDALQKATYVNLQNRDNASGVSGDSVGAQPPMEEDVLSKHPEWVGGVFIALGIFAIVGVLFPDFWSFVRRLHLGTVIVALAMIGFGLWLILNRHSDKNE
ncbi:hypothetical protein [Alicyclobacillus macrosporangiidus]|uniref:hypothetical protein n=1 Tax=Alicyclobacillus macrosporangiidus TaxID=392015 RepID=UPI000495F666|nr:hypothetical protein [Alicyclobacillus macrosporangiidus]